MIRNVQETAVRIRHLEMRCPENRLTGFYSKIRRCGVGK